MGVALVTATALSSLSGAAFAQVFSGIEQAPQYSRGYNTSVVERRHPEWDPIDLDLGGFTLRPEVDLTSQFNENEKYTKHDHQADVSWELRPSLSLASNWNRNGLGVDAYVDQTEYTRFGEDNTTEYGVTGTGRLDVTSDLAVDLKAWDQHLALGRSDPDVPADSRGVPTYDQQYFQSTVTKTLPEFQLQGIVAVRNEDYGKVGAPDGGVYDFYGRNGTYLSTSGRLSYGVSPAVAVFVGALYDKSFRPTIGLYSQDAQGANVAAGVNFDLTRLARGEVAIGYLYQSYSIPGVTADSGLAFNANIEYFPTQLTTITLVGSRSSAPTSVAGSPGGISTSATLKADHELLRNVILSAGVAIGQTDYSGYVISNARFNRQDTSYGGNLGATYLMNRLMSWRLAYAYTDYDTNDHLRRSYTDSRIALTLRLTR